MGTELEMDLLKSQKEGERSRRNRQSVSLTQTPNSGATPQVRTTNSNADGTALTGQTDKMKSSLNESGKLSNSAII